MDQTEKRDDALFDALNRKKQKRKRKIIRTVIIVLLVLAVVLVGGVLYLRRQVAKRFAGSGDDVTSAEATLGSISTQVSGSGTLLNVDEESLTVPANVEVEKVLVSANETVSEGQLLARVDLSTVLTAMSTLQENLNSLDEDITAAVGDAVSNTIKAGVAGRVKKIYAHKGDDVVACMAENGALALLSLDGKMAVREAQKGISKNDFLAKIYISLKETAETEYWIELLLKTNYISLEEYNKLRLKCHELKKILDSITKTTRR